MKFKSKKDCVCNGVKVYKNLTVIESGNDLSAEDSNWYKVGESSPAPESEAESVAKAISHPRISRIKK